MLKERKQENLDILRSFSISGYRPTAKAALGRGPAKTS